MNETEPPQARSNQLRLTLALQQVLHGDGDMAADAESGPLTLGRIIDATGERAFGVLMAFLCLPFLTPIPLPGLSILFGVALMLLGAQVAIKRHRPWLPARLMQWRLPPKLAPKIIEFVMKLFRPLEKIIRPRLLFMQNRAAMMVVGVALMADGFLLSLPLPPWIPLSNALPAWMALVKILGITEEDGISLLAGTAMTFAMVAGIGKFFAVIWNMAMTW